MKTKALRLLATGGLMAAVFAPSAAHAIITCAPETTCDPGTTVGAAGGGTGTLPKTGSDSSDLSLIGAGLAVSGGTLVVLAGKRRRRAAASA